jgi:hypothetical protein
MLGCQSPNRQGLKAQDILRMASLEARCSGLGAVQVKTKVYYLEVKEEMRKLLVDPHKTFNWKANPRAFLWDGKTPLHSVEAHIKRKVEKNEKGLGGDAKREAHFFRFRQAMANSPEYRSAIDLACGDKDQTLENALDIAKRLQRSKAEEPMNGSLGGQGKAYTAAASVPSEDRERIKMLELGMAKLTTQLEQRLPREPESSSGDCGRATERPRERQDDRPYNRWQDRPRQDSRNRDSYRDYSRDRNWRNESTNIYRDRNWNRDGFRNYSRDRNWNSSNRDFSRDRNRDASWNRNRGESRNRFDNNGRSRDNSRGRRNEFSRERGNDRGGQRPEERSRQNQNNDRDKGSGEDNERNRNREDSQRRRENPRKGAKSKSKKNRYRATKLDDGKSEAESKSDMEDLCVFLEEQKEKRNKNRLVGSMKQ